MAKTSKYVYLFGNKKADGDGSMKPLLGGKGANLAEMTRIGLPVPPGFTITTEVCTYYYANKRTYPKVLEAQIGSRHRLHREDHGHASSATRPRMPLLVSVRSGARDSMPGMMDTILNLGLNDQTVLALVTATKNERFAWDCYRRFVQMYGDVVMGVQKREGEDHEPFEVVIHSFKHEKYHADIEDSEADRRRPAGTGQALQGARSRSAPARNSRSDPWEQLWGATGAVFGSWMNDRAIVYRRKYNIPSEWGTAVNVQAMVYGNTGDTSGSGVAFTRNPANGAKEFYGEFLINAQGEDVVAGVRTPEPVAQLKKQMPAAYTELDQHPHHPGEALQGRAGLRVHHPGRQGVHAPDPQRQAHRRRRAEVLHGHGQGEAHRLEDRHPAATRPTSSTSSSPRSSTAKAEKAAKVIAKGLPAGPGAASGKIYLNADRAAAAAAKGEKVLLVRNETTPEDLRGMIAAEGILTAKGGVSSHAALVARQMGKVCVCGAGALAD